VSGGIAGAAVLGHIAGEGAVERMRDAQGALPDIDWDEAGRIRVSVTASMGRQDGIAWKEFEDRIRSTVTDYAGVRRSGSGLRLALNTLHALAREEERLVADDLHGAMRVQEARSIRMNAEIMASAALARTETRTRSAHRRLDFPEADNVNWRSFAVVEKGADGRPEVRALNASQPLSAAFARTSGSTPERSPTYAASA